MTLDFFYRIHLDHLPLVVVEGIFDTYLLSTVRRRHPDISRRQCITVFPSIGKKEINDFFNEGDLRIILCRPHTACFLHSIEMNE